MSILDKLANMTSVSTVPAKVEMTDEEFAAYKARLYEGNRLNVRPNRFDIAKPFKVSVNYSGEWCNYGVFSDVDVAAAIGTLVSLYMFKDKAMRGEFDAAKAEAHPEFQAWLKDPRNADVVRAASA